MAKSLGESKIQEESGGLSGKSWTCVALQRLRMEGLEGDRRQIEEYLWR